MVTFSNSKMGCFTPMRTKFIQNNDNFFNIEADKVSFRKNGTLYKLVRNSFYYIKIFHLST